MGGQGIAPLRPTSSPRPPSHGIFFTGLGSSPNSRAALPPRILRFAPSLRRGGKDSERSVRVQSGRFFTVSRSRADQWAKLLS